MARVTNTVIAAAALALAITCLRASHAVADDTPNPKALEQAYWSTPGDGRLVMLLRNAASFEQAIPLRVRVCVTNFTGANNAVNLFIWTTAGYQPGVSPGPQPQTRQLTLGECAEVDRPAAIIVQDSTTSGTSTGYYELFEQTSPPPEYVAPAPGSGGASPPTASKRHEHNIRLGAPAPVRANCMPLPPPPAGTAPSASYFAYCQLPLPPHIDPKSAYNGVRICTGVNYVSSDDGKMQYAAGYLEMIVDKRFVTTPKQSDYDYNFNPVTPQGCRDVMGASDIYFMVGPDAPGGYWIRPK